MLNASQLLYFILPVNKRQKYGYFSDNSMIFQKISGQKIAISI